MENLMFFKKESKIIDQDTQSASLKNAFDNKFEELNLGRRMVWFDEPIKTIKKGSETFHVSNASFFSATSDKKSKAYTHTHVFLVEKDGKFSEMLFMSVATPFLEGWQKKQKIEAVLNNEHTSLPTTVDIFDVYDLRFHLRNNKKAKQFMDDFILVSQEARKHYKLYEKQQVYRQKQASLLSRKVFGRHRD